MTTKQALDLFNKLRKKHNIPMVDVFFSKMKRILGLSMWNDNNGQITRFIFSKHYINFANEEQLTKHFLHEIAHAKDILNRGTTDHGEKWLEECYKLGYDGTTSGHLPLEYFDYIAFCNNCDSETVYTWFNEIKRIPKCKCCDNEMVLYQSKS